MPRLIRPLLLAVGLFLTFFTVGVPEAAAQSDLDQGCIYLTSASYDQGAGRLRVTSRGAGQYFVVAGFERGQTWIQNVGILPLTGQLIVLKIGSSASCQNNVHQFVIGGPYGLRGYVTTVWFGLSNAIVTPATPVDF